MEPRIRIIGFGIISYSVLPGPKGTQWVLGYLIFAYKWLLHAGQCRNCIATALITAIVDAFMHAKFPFSLCFWAIILLGCLVSS